MGSLGESSSSYIFRDVGDWEGAGVGHLPWISTPHDAAFVCAPHGPNYGKVELVRMFLMMFVDCMQSLVRQRHCRKEKMGCDFGGPHLKPVT